MAKASLWSPVPGSAFIRLLARLTDADIPPSSPALADRLGQWIDWTRAVAVSRALNGRLHAIDEYAPFESASATECARVRGALEQAIASDTGADAGRPPAKPGRGADPNAPPDCAPFRQRYLSLQRAMLAAPVKGLGFAFGTSIAGVASSAMLGLLAALCRRERLQAVQRLDLAIATTLHVHSQAFQRNEAFKLLQRQTDLMPALIDRLQALAAGIEQQGAASGERLASNQDAFHARTKAA